MMDDIGTRMSHIFLKEEPISMGSSASDDDVVVLKEVSINDCDDYSDKLRTRYYLRHMPNESRWWF
jgi:hypothetical protein